MNTLNRFILSLVLGMAGLVFSPVPLSAQTADAGIKSPVVEIVGMKYGSKPENLVAVTNKTLEMLKGGQKITISKSIVASDPAPGEKKYALLVFSVDGNRSSVKIMDGEIFEFASIQKEYVKPAAQKEANPTGVSAENRGVQGNQKTEKSNTSDFRASVNEAVDAVSKAVDSKVVGIHLLAYSKGFKTISDNPDVEKIMGIDNEWYLNISKMLAEMGRYKLEMELSQQRNLAQRFDAAKTGYMALVPKFKYLMEHPVKVQRK